MISLPNNNQKIVSDLSSEGIYAPQSGRYSGFADAWIAVKDDKRRQSHSEMKSLPSSFYLSSVMRPYSKISKISNLYHGDDIEPIFSYK